MSPVDTFRRPAVFLPLLLIACSVVALWLLPQGVLVLPALLMLVLASIWLGRALGRLQAEEGLPSPDSTEGSVPHQVEMPVPVLVCSADQSARVEFANPYAARLLRLGIEELPGMPLGELLGEQGELPVCLDGLERAGQVHSCRCQLNDERWLMLTVSLDGSCSPARLICVLEDVTAQHRNDESLRQYERLSNASDAGLAMVGRDLTLQLVNQHFLDMLQQPRTALLGLPVERLFGQDAGVSLNAALARCLQGEPGQLQYWVEYAGVGQRFVRFRFLPCRDEDGLIIGVALSAIDLTEAEREREARGAGDRRYRAMLENLSHCVIYSRHPQRGFDYISPSLEPLLGLSPAQFEERFEAAIAQTGEDMNASGDGLQLCIPGGDGRHHQVTVRETPEWAEGNELAALHGMVLDVSEQQETLAALRDSEERYRAVFELESDAVFLFDIEDDYRIVDCNRAAERIYGYEREELLRMCGPQLSAEPAQSVRFLDEVSLRGRGTVLRKHCRRNGHAFPIESSLQRFTLKGRRILCTIIRDVSERQRSENALRESKDRFRAIVEASPLPLIISRLSDGIIVYANALAEQTMGLGAGALTGRGLNEFYRDRRVRLELLEKIRRERRLRNHEIELRDSNGESRWFAVNASVFNFLGEPSVAAGLVDITDTHNLARQLSYQASHDALTGLVNRREFELRLSRAIGAAQQRGAEHALCYLDLDQFKLINDTCGHSAGDDLLRQLAAVLAGEMRSRDTLARLGGDEFGVLIEHCELEQAARIADKLRGLVERFRFQRDGKSFNVGVSIGVVLIDHHALDVSSLLKAADNACYAAKDAGRNRIYVYRDDDDTVLRRRSEIEWVGRIQQALEEGGLVLYRQPIVPLSREGAEAHSELLLRMLESDGSLVLPGAFLPAVERYNMAPQIDLWVVSQVLEHLQRDGSGEVYSVNLSGQTIGDAASCDRIESLLSASSARMTRLCFEVTETATIANLEAARRFLSRLKRLGCRIALDDFGSGLSSYAYLKTLPVDYLKIDGMFVRDITQDPIDYALVKSINEIGHVLGKLTIAECVESEVEKAMLSDIGVDFIQGFGVGRPVPLDASSVIEYRAEK